METVLIGRKGGEGLDGESPTYHVAMENSVNCKIGHKGLNGESLIYHVAMVTVLIARKGTATYQLVTH